MAKFDETTGTFITIKTVRPLMKRDKADMFDGRLAVVLGTNPDGSVEAYPDGSNGVPVTVETWETARTPY